MDVSALRLGVVAEISAVWIQFISEADGEMRLRFDVDWSCLNGRCVISY